MLVNITNYLNNLNLDLCTVELVNKTFAFIVLAGTFLFLIKAIYKKVYLYIPFNHM